MRFVIGRTTLALLATAFLAAPGVADEIFLRGGGRVVGVIVERTPDSVVLETAPGRVTLPMRRIERIVESRSALEVFQERAAAVSPDDVERWAALARWAGERELLTQAREAWQRVLAANPSHREANAALQRVELDGAWMGADEAYRARGYVEFEGRWVTPSEHEALIRERAAEDTSAQERREAGLRVREAEARAREAEARAREAEAAAQTPAEDGGIPLWWGGGFLPPLLPSNVEPPPPEHRGRHEPRPQREPPPSTPPSSVGPAEPHRDSGTSKPAGRPQHAPSAPPGVGGHRQD